MKKSVLQAVFLLLFFTKPAIANTAPPAYKISAGMNHNMAIMVDGTLWTWGNNWFGQLGDGTTTDQNEPIQIDANWAAIDAGYSYSLGIKTDGTLWSWGNNYFGQLGDGTTTDRYLPTQIGTDTNWRTVSAGSGHSLAIKTDGTLWAWGNNSSGQLGDATFINKAVPTLVAGSGWLDASAGKEHVLAIKTDGGLWAWGSSSYGQLGNGMSGFGENKNTPVLIGSNWFSIFSGDLHSIAIKTDGDLWGWGKNLYGQIGDGADKNLPAQIMSDLFVISAGSNHTAGLNGAGEVFELGSSNSSLTDVRDISAGNNHTLAIKTDGTIWARGDSGDNGWRQITTVISPSITLSRKGFYFTAIAGGPNPANQILNISNIGASGWTTTANQSWISLPSVSGVGSSAALSINVNIAGPAGIYNGSILLSAGIAASQQTVLVRLKIIPALVITTTSLPDGKAESAYNKQLSAAGGIAPYTWLVAGLPAGLNFDTETISGTPSVFGKFNIQIQVQDSNSPPSVSAKTVLLNIASLPLPDLIVSGLVISESVTPGKNILIKDTTKNQGAVASGGSITNFYISTDKSLSAADRFLGSRLISPLKSGEINKGSSFVTIPAEFTPGLYFVIAAADSDYRVNEFSETNNSTLAAITLNNRSDLIVDAVRVVSIIYKGKSVSITDTVKNVGLYKSNAAAVEYYLSTNTIADVHDALLASRPLPVILPGGKNKGSKTVKIPKISAAGKMYILVVVDRTNVVGESNDLNNTRAISVTVK